VLLIQAGLQIQGGVGHAEARLIKSEDIVQVVTKRIEANETVFLHPLGVDEECDEARTSLLV
jgi:hypothetical protein